MDRGFYIGVGGNAEERALGKLKINFVHFTVLSKVEIKPPFSKNLKSSFYSKNFLPWNCESLEYIIKVIHSVLRVF